MTMFVIGAMIGVLSVGLIAISLHNRDVTAVKTAKQSNQQAQTANAGLQKDLAAGAITQAQFDEQKTEIEPVTWLTKNSWLVSSSIVGVVSFGLLVLATLILLKRDKSLPITWAEAVVYSGVLFFFLILVNGVIPHFMIDLWDNVIKLRGEFTVPLTKSIASLWESKAQGMEWGWFVIRDMIVAGWYIVTLVLMIALWYWTQELPKRSKKSEKPGEAKVLTSPYGRPMLSATGK